MGGNSGQGNSTISAETFLSPEPAPLLPEIRAALPVRDGFFPLFANWPDRNNRLIFNVFPKECRYFGAGGIFPKSGPAGSKERRARRRAKRQTAKCRKRIRTECSRSCVSTFPGTPLRCGPIREGSPRVLCRSSFSPSRRKDSRAAPDFRPISSRSALSS